MNDEVNHSHWDIRQGRETKESTFKPELNEYQDDIAAVTLAYHLPYLLYVDFSRESALNSAFSRWTLLTELNQRQVSK